VTTIGASAFSACTSLTSINIPTGVTVINASTFSSCVSLTSIEIPSGVTSIGTSAFYFCQNLETITIPSGAYIGTYAFQYCYVLDNITVPGYTTAATFTSSPYQYIAETAFDSCTNLTTVNTPADSYTRAWFDAYFDLHPRYDVTLNANEGTITAGGITSYLKGFTSYLPANSQMTRTGYTFAGWYADENFSTARVYYIPTTATGDQVFYAKWDEVVAATHSVIFITNGGQINSGGYIQYTEGAGTLLPTDVTRTGFTFGGWYSNTSFTGDALTSIPISATSDLTL
jgi:uncharacterized repeat protein (TIGR02543 family)